ncbi:membrane protein [Ophiostoma piceae UAMH 11346]|uniref:Membrane protein n=1 Tax=Ophiostoma piceae (strain UAMH 11346) TaxID=1262450 RepID=S3BT41_OPHP1|nr:membrane protein [Ophiostoma piceae UAMH 11346]
MSPTTSEIAKVDDGHKNDLPKSWGDLPLNTDSNDPAVGMVAYEHNVPLWQRVYRNSSTQMMLLSVQAFCGPAMADAIAGLGGGGLATPQTSNTATAISYSMLATEGITGGITPNTYIAFMTIECLAVGCFGLGFILDFKTLSQRRRAQLGLFTVVILNLGVYIWSIVMQVRFDANPPGKIDWDDSLFPTAFLLYFSVQTTGPLSQSYMYWLLSSFATDAQANVRNGAAFRCIEAVGQAIAYGMNTKTSSTPLVGFCVTFGLMAAALGPTLLLVNSTPDRIPADVTIEHENKNKPTPPAEA